jgi:hypothetical protein
MQNVPEWITIALAFVSAVGVGGWLMETYKRRFPTPQEKINLKSSDADFVRKYTDAQVAQLELTKQIQVLVDEKTRQLENMLVQRELVHAQQVENFIKRLADETALKEDYYDQLKDARLEVAYWKKLYEDLQGRPGNRQDEYHIT